MNIQGKLTGIMIAKPQAAAAATAVNRSCSVLSLVR
jgi:hypothetical protein